ncbi:hypothetical protein [Williamsia sterculiae]|uniref:Uncharacterized protein n=1 Tax=Williamsia sterculiae TaxID=1344003 RepID=A0A1N7F810_9NOCA|nr:hypothetical protein [Williamsia sterculiae]SIR96463.1 hypothetical protein SAMN05445060_1911 [Williamsia sterculiae]
MPTVKNVKLLLSDGRDFEYPSAQVTVQESGVLRLEVDGMVSLYSASGWACLTHDAPQRGTTVRRLR